MLKEYFKSIEDVSATEWLLCMLIAIMAAMLSINGDGMLCPRSTSTAAVMFCSPVIWTFSPGGNARTDCGRYVCHCRAGVTYKPIEIGQAIPGDVF